VSNPLAIMAVTAAFAQLLKRVLEDPDLAGAKVTHERPVDATEAGRRLNLFLFQVSANPALRNSDLPFRDNNGGLVAQPVTALNLHYLLTTYGKSDSELDAHHLLAHAMSIVHDNGVLTRAQIRSALGSLPTLPELQKSDLADQVEPVKLTPLAMTMEEHFKLWSTFQAPYRLSVGYEASVVLVERRKPARPLLPVRRAAVTAVPLRRPRIDAVVPQIVTVGEAVTLSGQDLRGTGAKVRFASGDIPPGAGPEGGLRVTPPATLRAGVHTLQVVHELRYGDPPTARAGFESNAVPFMRAPRITTPSPLTVARGASLTVGVTLPVGRAQRAALLLGGVSIPLGPRPQTPETTNDLTFPIPADMPVGRYLVRVQVDGADSPLEVETDPQSPDFDAYVAPVVDVT
jgi:hypothetical protein